MRPETREAVESIKARYQAQRDDPMTPQYLTGRGQSGSLLDYQEAEDIGETICRMEGEHRLGPANTDGIFFCSRCGNRFDASGARVQP